MQPELIGGRYRVGRAIGQGGMGTVWLCRDETLHREVAVKQVGLLPGESVTDSARAFREARSSAALSHRNVVTVFDVVEDHGAIWLVMEHVPGRSLSEIIKQDGPLEPAVVADIGAQVADGLAAAHAVGTMHRDVKPGNVLVREDGVAKISDFGIARSAGDPALTQSGFLTGTPSYFSPELARGGDPGPGTDVWALGATLYAAVEGRPPYEQRPNPVAVLHDITSGQPPQARPRRLPGAGAAADDGPQPGVPLVDGGRGARPAPAGRHPRRRTHPREHGRRRPGDRGRPGGGCGPGGRAASRRPPRTSTTTPVPPTPRRGAAEVRCTPCWAPSRCSWCSAAWPTPRRCATTPRPTRRAPATRAAPPSRPPARPRRSAPRPRRPSRPPHRRRAPDAEQHPVAQHHAAGRTGIAAQRAFLEDYFSKAPGGTDAAWAMLTPAYQGQHPRSSYDGFWSTISSVSVSNVQSAGDGAVDATLTYTKDGGGTSSERHRIDLARSGDGYLIDGDGPA